MPNDIMPVADFVKKLTTSFQKSAEEYQQKSGCSDKEKNTFAQRLAHGCTSGLFFGYDHTGE